MSAAPRPSIVLLGMLTKIPVGGVVWLVAQYALGFQRLGYDVYYVEAHGRTPSMLMNSESDDPVERAGTYLRETLTPFGLGDRWAFHDPHTGRCAGMEHSALRRLYSNAALIINLHGGTLPLDEHAASGRLVYLGTDPVELELELHRGEQHAVDFLAPHVAFFTWGLNYGNPDCVLPWSEQFPFVPSPPPVVVDLWDHALPVGRAFTTVGNWRQPWRQVEYDGQVYTWSKHHEFLKVLDLPSRTGQPFELALSSYQEDDRALLEAHGWTVRPGLDVSREPDTYRDFIRLSRGEFSVAKDQNVRLRSGWFSERSATYLAAGRPVIMQDTGFSNALPVGVGLLPFVDLESAAAAVEQVAADYGRHSAAAREVAREHLDADVVLPALLEHVGLGRGAPSARRQPEAAVPLAVVPAGRPPTLPHGLVLEPLSRRPMLLPPASVEAVTDAPVPVVPKPVAAPVATVVVVTWNNLLFTRMALESLLANTGDVPYEVVVVDNASSDGTAEYLSVLATRNHHVRVLRNATNRGFAAANNQGLAEARGDVLVLLNNDTVVPPGWLSGLIAHLSDGVGLVGPVTNRICNEAEISVDYSTYGEMLAFARACRRLHGRDTFDIRVLAMFCLAMTRQTYERLGPLDEDFGVGTLEDDDYSMRARAAGLGVICAEGVFVHHFSQASFAELIVSGEYEDLRAVNRARLEEKWGEPWQPYQKRHAPDYGRLVDDVRGTVAAETPPGCTVLVVSKGDDALLALKDRRALHFPHDDSGYAGHYPATSEEAVSLLDEHADRPLAVVFPRSAFWWLTHYPGLKMHLDTGSRRVHKSDDCIVYLL